MACPVCGLDNLPSAAACDRCNTPLGQPEPPTGVTYAPRRPSRLVPLLSALSIVVSLLVIGVVVYRDRQEERPAAAPVITQSATTPTPPPAPPTTTVAAPAVDPRPQAAVIDGLLDRSGASRDKLNGAIDRVGRCTGVGGALADLREVGDERRAQLAEVREADLSALAAGEQLRSGLVTALQHSLDADEAYVDWAAPAVTGGCGEGGSRRAAFERGRAASDRAGAAKETFLAAWNPVARQWGLPVRTRQDI